MGERVEGESRFVAEENWICQWHLWMSQLTVTDSWQAFIKIASASHPTFEVCVAQKEKDLLELRLCIGHFLCLKIIPQFNYFLFSFFFQFTKLCIDIWATPFILQNKITFLCNETIHINVHSGNLMRKSLFLVLPKIRKRLPACEGKIVCG